MTRPRTPPFEAGPAAAGPARLCTAGVLRWSGGESACAFGRRGLIEAAAKREGDGATPVGAWVMREVFYRPDRLARPRCILPVTALTLDMGWCDDPAHPFYNRRVPLPFAAGHETLWRADGLYDLILPLGYNDAPAVSGLGSAIFLHCAAPALTPTEGCLALPRDALLAVIAAIRPHDALRISLSPA
jgi:L,D-peptidoglycan transpeptidase YkuD (ErfK/YbiS/YcfS/YnhG family)